MEFCRDVAQSPQLLVVALGYSWSHCGHSLPTEFHFLEAKPPDVYAHHPGAASTGISTGNTW